MKTYRDVLNDLMTQGMPDYLLIIASEGAFRVIASCLGIVGNSALPG